MTRFYKTVPNRTSGIIKLTPPVDSYTIVLLVLTLSPTQTSVVTICRYIDSIDITRWRSDIAISYTDGCTIVALLSIMYNDVGEARHMVYGIPHLIKLCVDGVVW